MSFSLRDLFSRLTFGMVAPAPADIVVVQDSRGIGHHFRQLESALRARGVPIHIKMLEDRSSLMKYLGQLQETRQPLPRALIMDCMGVGAEAAMDVTRWRDAFRPDQPLPEMHFLSLAVSLAADQSGILRLEDPRHGEAGFISPDELSWTQARLRKKTDGTPQTVTLRRMLNRLYGLTLPLDVDQQALDALNSTASADQAQRAMTALRKKQITPAQALDSVRGFVAAMEKWLRYGLAGTAEGQPADAAFYEQSGFPIRGRVVFSPEAAMNYTPATPDDNALPILVAQRYDPALLPLLSGGRLGGLIVLSPYMASHLKLLCDSRMVSGLFGLLPESKTLRAAFNEEACPALPPFIRGDHVALGDDTLRENDEVVLGLNGKGLIFKPATMRDFRTRVAQSAEENLPYQNRLSLLVQIRTALKDLLRARGLRVPALRINLNNSTHRLEWLGEGVGLVRTEQIAAGNEKQRRLLRAYLLDRDPAALQPLLRQMKRDYTRLMHTLEDGLPVRIRLFDLSPAELFDDADMRRFRALYGTDKIDGGAALAAWPGLYRAQVTAIMAALPPGKYAPGQLQVMMPSVRTGADAAQARALVREAAAAQGAGEGRCRFGAMIETRDACENRADILPHCDFISFGTNDLTQDVLGIGRGDLPARAAFAAGRGFDPFRTLAPEIRALVASVAADAHALKPDMTADACGAHAAHLPSALQLLEAGLDSLSVNPDHYNLYILPLLVNYALLDAANRRPAPAPGASAPGAPPGP